MIILSTKIVVPEYGVWVCNPARSNLAKLKIKLKLKLFTEIKSP